MTIDDKLIKAIKKKDSRTILNLYKFTYSKIMSVTVRYYVNKEDQITIVNNSFMKVIGNIEKFEPATSYFAWVNRIVYNEIISVHRKEKKYKQLFNFEAFDSASDKYHDSDSFNTEKIELNELLKMITELPKATRIVFDMYAIEGDYTYKEVADFLEVSTETVKWHLKKARNLLKGMIKNHNQQEYAS